MRRRGGMVPGALLALGSSWVAVVASPATAVMAEPASATRQARDTLFGAVRGVAFDSVASRALSGATVRLAGSELSAATDGQGRFVLDRVPQGEHRLTLEHPDVSGWLTTLAAAAVSVRRGTTAEVVLAVPSAETLAARHCPAGAAAVVGGVAMDLLTLVPLPGAEISLARPAGGGGREDRVQAEPDGTYHFCLSEPGPVSVEARLGDARSRTVRLDTRGEAVVQRDLFVQATRPALIEGIVRDESTGDAIRDVLIRIDGYRTGTVSDERGRFTLSGVPPGDLTLVAEHVAYGEARGRISVSPEDTLDVEIGLRPAAIPLDAMEVVVRSRATPSRLAMGTRFDGVTRAEIEAMLPRTSSFPELLERANVPGLHVQRVQYADATGIMTPGVCVEVSRRRSMYPRLCLGMVAVFLNDAPVRRPEEFLLDLDPASIDRFQLLSPLEAIGRYGGPQARNGVLLIYTRGH